MDKARIYIDQQLKIHKNLILVGDFNIVPNESDAHNFSAEDILCSDKERMALNSLVDLGLNDCFQGEEDSHHIHGGITEPVLFTEMLGTVLIYY